MKKLFLKSLFAAACCLVFPAGMFAQFSGSGSGTKDDPYRIFNTDQLNQVRNFVGKTDVYFSLEADIDMTQWIAENNPSQGWQPITSFGGTFNGNGHTIKNLRINRPKTDYIGLFGRISGRVQNLKLENANYVGKDYVGGIAGYISYATIESCTFNGKIEGNAYVGGISGYIGNIQNGKSNINNCISNSSLSGNRSVGGICGHIRNAAQFSSGSEVCNRLVTITGCSSYCNINGGNFIGGICGYNDNSNMSDNMASDDSETIISECCSYSRLNGGNYIGGISGFNRSSDSYHSRIYISSCYSYGCMIGDDYIGGICGNNANNDGSEVNISDCYSNGIIKGNNLIGGIAGCDSSTDGIKGGILIIRCYSNELKIQGDDNIAGIIGGSFINSFVKNNVSANEIISAYESVYRIGNIYAGNNLACTDTRMYLNEVIQPILEDSKEHGTSTDLATLKLQATYESLGWDFADTWQIEETESFPYFKNQTAPPYFQQALKKGDTNLSGQCAEAGTVTVSIGDKVYTVQSSGNTWSLTLDEPLQAGDIVNVIVQAEGKMPSYVVNQTVSLAGSGTENDPYVISTPEDMLTFSSDAYYKLANDIDLTEWIETNSPADGWIPVTLHGTFDGDGHTISGLWCNAENGGLFDKLVPGAAIKNVKVKIADGKAVKGSDYVGGIVAINRGTVMRCMVTGKIEGDSIAGGIAGQSGGLISQCYTRGEITSETSSAKAGGIAGENLNGSSVSNCYNTADVTTTDDDSYAAGIVWYNSGTIERCYSTGAILGYVVAGICGANIIAGAKVYGCVAANRSLSGTTWAPCILSGSAYDVTPATTDNYAYEGIPVTVNGIPKERYDNPYDGSAKTLEELHKKATYETLGWDMENIWKIDEGSSLPYFAEFSIPVSEISLDNTEATIERQSTLQLIATVLPEDCINSTLTWTSDNEEVATVDENGLVTAVSVGEANITATAVDGSGVTATCKVTVSPKLVTSVTLNKNELTIEKSFTAQLAATVAPDDADDLGLTWTSDNEEVATVDENGLVTAVSAGEANITATAVDGSGVTATCKVTVTPKLVTSVILDESELTIEKNFTEQLTATVAPDDADNLSLTWTSDNEEVATVDENGLVTAVGEGTATITATANDGSGVSASCVVTVTFIDGIADIEASKVTVLAANGRITVSGKEQDETVSVYDMGGRLLYQGESDVIDVPRKAMYIVTVSGKNYKVIVP